MTLNILIIDDDEVFCEIVRSYLHEYSVQMAHDATAAIDMLLAAPPDVILLDVHLPGTDGFEILELLKSQEKYRSIPVVMVSADESPQTKQRAVAIGAHDFIIKPVTSARMQGKIYSLNVMIESQRNLGSRQEKFEIIEKPRYMHIIFYKPVDGDTAAEVRRMLNVDQNFNLDADWICLDFRYQKDNDKAILACAVALMASLEPIRCVVVSGTNYPAFVYLPIDIERELFISYEDFEHFISLRLSAF